MEIYRGIMVLTDTFNFYMPMPTSVLVIYMYVQFIIICSIIKHTETHKQMHTNRCIHTHKSIQMCILVGDASPCNPAAENIPEHAARAQNEVDDVRIENDPSGLQCTFDVVRW